MLAKVGGQSFEPRNFSHSSFTTVQNEFKRIIHNEAAIHVQKVLDYCNLAVKEGNSKEGLDCETQTKKCCELLPIKFNHFVNVETSLSKASSGQPKALKLNAKELMA